MSQSSSIQAARFNQRLVDLANRLSKHDLVVSKLECYWGLFGSWTMEIEDGEACDRYGKAILSGVYDVCGPRVVQVFWDGRDRELTISEAPTPPLSGPTRWKPLHNGTFLDSDTALMFAEEFVLKWQRA